MRKVGRTDISVRMTELDARLMSHNFCTNERYLKDIISNYCPGTLSEVDHMDYRTLRRYGHVIKSVSEKILRNSNHSERKFSTN